MYKGGVGYLAATVVVALILFTPPGVMEWLQEAMVVAGFAAFAAACVFALLAYAWGILRALAVTAASCVEIALNWLSARRATRAART